MNDTKYQSLSELDMLERIAKQYLRDLSKEPKVEVVYWDLMQRIDKLSYDEIERFRSQKGSKILLELMLSPGLYKERKRESIRGDLIVFHAVLNVNKLTYLKSLERLN